MTKQEILRQKESTLVGLLAQMERSDAHALKCFKLGKQFATEYPEEAAAYADAREEYNTVESEIESLKAEIAAEEQAALEEKEA